MLPEYGVVRGARSGVGRLPFWAATLSPALLLTWLGLYGWHEYHSSGRRAPSERVWRAVSPLLLTGAAVPTLVALGAWLIRGTSLMQGAYSPIFYRRDRFHLIEHGEIRLSPPPTYPLGWLTGGWLPEASTRARLESADGTGTVHVYNVHLDWVPWDGKRAGRTLRESMDRDWDGSPQLLMGDFNADQGGDVFDQLMAPPVVLGAPPALQAAWPLARRREGPYESYHLGLGEPIGLGRLDHLLVRSGVRVERTVTVTEHDGSLYPSDHFPVVADLMIERPART
jgi:endonuclease/exonuclease/phosphatase family metal-dependent hydrolase